MVILFTLFVKVILLYLTGANTIFSIQNVTGINITPNFKTEAVRQSTE
jgi:hypothetical protein